MMRSGPQSDETPRSGFARKLPEKPAERLDSGMAKRLPEFPK